MSIYLLTGSASIILVFLGINLISLFSTKQDQRKKIKTIYRLFYQQNPKGKTKNFKINNKVQVLDFEIKALNDKLIDFYIKREKPKTYKNTTNEELKFSFINNLYFLINFSLFKSIFELLDKYKRKSKETKLSRKEVLQVTIVSLLAIKKIKDLNLTYIFLLLTIILYLIFSVILSNSLDLTVIFVVTILIVANFLNKIVLEYRIKKGFYGTNEYEAREILSFIKTYNNDFNNFDGKEITIFPPTEESKNDEVTLSHGMGWES